MSTDPAISLRHVSFSFGRTPVLEDVNFELPPRAAACMIGPNGGGKTTLVRLILGLLTPQQGEIRLFGQLPRRSRLRTGYMPQHLHYDAQFPVTVMDIVLMGRLGHSDSNRWFGWYGRADRAAARKALQQVGMEGFGRRPLASLSGGERQRVLIARALCGDPELLVLDEPTSNVDTLVEARLLDILRELNERMTILMVSHDLGFVSHLVESVVCVNRRVIVHPTSEITGTAIEEIYGGSVRAVHHHGQVFAAEQAHE